MRGKTLSIAFAFSIALATAGPAAAQTFEVNQYGTIYQKDFGPNTAALVGAIARFNPDATWQLVEKATD